VVRYGGTTSSTSHSLPYVQLKQHARSATRINSRSAGMVISTLKCSASNIPVTDLKGGVEGRQGAEDGSWG